jgi:hypothetical protein
MTVSNPLKNLIRYIFLADQPFKILNQVPLLSHEPTHTAVLAWSFHTCSKSTMNGFAKTVMPDCLGKAPDSWRANPEE